MRLKYTVLVSALLVAVSAWPVAAQVVINEILPNPGSYYDGAEFVELHNTTAAPVSIAGWVLTGTEYSGTCGGEDHQQFPAGATIPANGYVTIAKDNMDSAGNEEDGFLQRFGFNASYECYDADRSYEYDDPSVPNLAILTNSTFDDQILLIPGNGYGTACLGQYNQYEALYLYNGVPGMGGAVVDVIEYRSTICASDACLGVGTSDDDAYVGFPDTGESLGRDASSGDTGNSSVDLILGTPTPGAANIANIGPTLSDMGADNPGPVVGESVGIALIATDADGIGDMFLVYTPDGSPSDSVAMSLTGPDTYGGTIPAQADGAIVRYFVRASDGGNAAGVGTSKYPDFGTRSIRWGTQTIVGVQFVFNPAVNDTSPEFGNPVNIEGIVVSEPGLYSAGKFVIQSANALWSGVHCFDALSEATMQRGDSVRVSGVVEEYYNLTEVKLFGAENVEILSTGNALPGPAMVSCNDLATGNPAAEAREGTYAELSNVQVTLLDTYGQFEVTDASGSAKVGDDAFYNYNPTLGDSLQTVRGVADYSYSERKLEPRDDADIIGPPLVTSMRYSPTPPTASSPVTFSCEITDNGTIARAKLFFSFDNGATYDSTDMVNTTGDSWEVAMGPYAAGTEVDYHVETTDNEGFLGRAPSIGDYDVYVGFLTIEAIQSTTIDGDSSSYEGSPVNVAGIVTAAPGTFADNTFYIQNNWVTDPSYRGIAVYSGGSLVGQLAVGDSVSLSGDVDEYYNFTQIRMHFTDAYTNHGPVGQLPAYQIATTDLPDSNVAVSEPWESVLVMAANSVVTNATAGYGQWYIDNTAPTTGTETMVDDFGPYTYQPVLGDSLSVRGVVQFSYGAFKVQPRSDSDILPFDLNDAVGVEIGSGPLAFQLSRIDPNPFTGSSAQIRFSIPHASTANLAVYDVTGRLVRTLVNGPVDAGHHVVDWDGSNQDHRAVSSGVYFYRLKADGQEATRKVTVLK